jgi:ribosomal-protein-alanine N-acetyltransferase
VARTALTPILQTARLELRHVTLADAAFLLKLLNDPSWVENIGDRGVRSHADAESYIRSTLWSQHETYGYGMYVVQRTGAALPVGICGLVKREFLPAPDLGVALLPDSVGLGLASEAARAVMVHAQSKLGIERLYGIVKRGNHRSVALLGRLGFRREGPSPAPPAGVEVELYVWHRSGAT